MESNPGHGGIRGGGGARGGGGGDQTFSDKVCREASIVEEVLVLEGVVQLTIRHAPTLKPAVKDVLHPAQHTPALAAGDGEVVDLVAVEVCDLQADPLVRLQALQSLSWEYVQNLLLRFNVHVNGMSGLELKHCSLEVVRALFRLSGTAGGEGGGGWDRKGWGGGHLLGGPCEPLELRHRGDKHPLLPVL